MNYVTMFGIIFLIYSPVPVIHYHQCYTRCVPKVSSYH